MAAVRPSTTSTCESVMRMLGAGVTSVATPLGNIPVGSVNYGQYRMKMFMKVSF